MHFPPFPGTQFTLCLPLHSDTAERYFFQCLVYPDGLISVNKDLDVVFTTSREHFAEDKYKSAMKMSHRPAAGSLHFCSRETSSRGHVAFCLLSHPHPAAASYQTHHLWPTALKHFCTGSVLCSLLSLGLLKHEIKRICLCSQRGIDPGLADAESIQGWV